jgi:predicted methyltransferase
MRARRLVLLLLVACGHAAPATPGPGASPEPQAAAPAPVLRAEAPRPDQVAGAVQVGDEVAREVADEVAHEVNVRPEANREYLSPDLDVQAWVQRFERAGRDIYDHRHELVTIAGVRPGVRVADLGAGTGLFSRLFARAVGPTGVVYAVDIAPRFLEHIQRTARAQGLGNISTILGDARSTNLPPASVDVAFLCDVYHHFEYPRAMLASIRKALRPGGRLVLVDFERIPGKSAAWVFDHVRADKETFVREIEAAGFVRQDEVPLLRENYVVRFRAPD